MYINNACDMALSVSHCMGTEIPLSDITGKSGL